MNGEVHTHNPDANMTIVVLNDSVIIIWFSPLITFIQGIKFYVNFIDSYDLRVLLSITYPTNGQMMFFQKESEQDIFNSAYFIWSQVDLEDRWTFTNELFQPINAELWALCSVEALATAIKKNTFNYMMSLTDTGDPKTNFSQV